MPALSRRALRNEVRTLEAQRDQERSRANRAESENARLRHIDDDNQQAIANLQTRIVRLRSMVRELRHYQGRRDMDLVGFIQNAHRAEMAEHRAARACRERDLVREELRLATVRLEEMTEAMRGAA